MSNFDYSLYCLYCFVLCNWDSVCNFFTLVLPIINNTGVKNHLGGSLSVIDHTAHRIQDFPEEGAPTPGGAPTYDFAKFSQKLHEIERIWPSGGGGGWGRAPPLRSATG